jgi:hypothetical protein
MWPTNYDLDIEETVVGMQPVIIDLDEMYIGPNIRYYIQYSQSEKSLSYDELESEDIDLPIK